VTLVVALATFTCVYLTMVHPIYVFCDRSVTRRRIGITSRSADADPTTNHETVADVLQSVASRMRTGVSASEALDDELTNIDVDRNSFVTLIGADLMEVGTPTELEQHAAHHRSQHLMAHDVLVHTAQARASAKVLTAAPVVFLAVMIVGSASLRARLTHSPTLLTAVIIGLALNFSARRWMTRLIADATHVDDRERAVTDIHELVSVALSAGHTVPDALHMAHAACDTHGRDLLDMPVQHLMAGGTVAEALSMMSSESHLRSLARVLADSQRHGTPVAQVASQVTSSAHRVRRKILDERIRRLPVRLAAPLIAGVLPAFILLAVLPLIAASMSSFDVAPRNL
jgi:Flp pilus assembly protein TadB